MGFIASEQDMNTLMSSWTSKYQIFAPKRFKNGGAFSDTDCVRYGEVSTIDEIVFNEKSQYSFKEVVLPAVQTLFFFTEDTIKEPDLSTKDIIVFLRSCDIHALTRLDTMYLKNGPADYYYSNLRNRVKLVLMGCDNSFENCFCVSMGTNRCHNYDLSINETADGYQLDCKNQNWIKQISSLPIEDVTPAYVTENSTVVSISDKLDISIANNSIWDEYDIRCIACGRCNFACPTCTCFTMQDMFYGENYRVGERRRVWASCMVDQFTDVAGGGSYRQKHGQRMRFKVLHKILDYKQRTGMHMCVGCGRCDDICPEYISFSHCINKLSKETKEATT